MHHQERGVAVHRRKKGLWRTANSWVERGIWGGLRRRRGKDEYGWMCANGRARTCTNKRFHFSTLPRPPIDLTKPQRLDKLSTTPTSEPTPLFSLSHQAGGSALEGSPLCNKGKEGKQKQTKHRAQVIKHWCSEDCQSLISLVSRAQRCLPA